mgnify:CR=1 FL=1
MVKIFPFIFILLWSSAFITTKPIIDNSDPFSALAFRFALVAFGFFLFCLYAKQKIFINKKNLIESFLSGVLFHGVYLGGVFFSISKGMPTGIAALIVTLQPILTNALSGPILNEKVTTQGYSISQNGNRLATLGDLTFGIDDEYFPQRHAHIHIAHSVRLSIPKTAVERCLIRREQL